MKDLYTKTSIECSALITRRYSTSFSLGILMIDKSLRNDIYSIYGFVRLADEIVDTYQHKNPSKELRLLREETLRAIDNRLSFNPVLQAFQYTVNHYKIEIAYIDAFFHSMELDLKEQKYNSELYSEYIYGSAEVVGLMCLKVFCGNDHSLFEKLTLPARKLGSAFQKINFLRDIKSDLEDRKRIYFPGLDLQNFKVQKSKIEDEIELEFKEAQLGINLLPRSSRMGVQLAANYYKGLLCKIRKCKPEQLLENRIRISNIHKLKLLIGNLLYSRTLHYGHG